MTNELLTPETHTHTLHTITTTESTQAVHTRTEDTHRPTQATPGTS